MEVRQSHIEQFAKWDFSKAMIYGYTQSEIAIALLQSVCNDGKNELINEIAIRSCNSRNEELQKLATESPFFKALHEENTKEWKRREKQFNKNTRTNLAKILHIFRF